MQLKKVVAWLAPVMMVLTACGGSEVDDQVSILPVVSQAKWQELGTNWGVCEDLASYGSVSPGDSCSCANGQYIAVCGNTGSHMCSVASLQRACQL
jgi:hypothetical protein